MRKETVVKELKCLLTEPELLDIARSMAKAQSDLMAAQDRKAEVVSELGAQIKRHHADVQEYSRVIGNGYRFRDVQCQVLFDHPSPNMKTVFRLDTGEEVDSGRMTDPERQMSIKFYERTAETAPTEDDAVMEVVAGICITCQGVGQCGDLVCPDCNGFGHKPQSATDDVSSDDVVNDLESDMDTEDESDDSPDHD